MADMLASTLAGATAVAALVNYRIIMYMHAAETSCEFPIDPMGKLLTCLPRLTLAQLPTLRSTTGGVCHRDLENFPSPRWETNMLPVVCRAVVSWSRVAQ
jgi:hypothetical protein